MRLTYIAVRNYRVHRDLKVEFDAARTLIGGANESGKSTLAEAAHRALFLRAKTGGESQKAMISKTHGGHPEVEVGFECRGRAWRLLKRFSGAGGTVTLTETDGSSTSGDEAEDKLADLLGVERVAGGRGAGERAAQQWAHLWAWQGTASDDPAGHANAQRDTLMERLQGGDGAAAMQSALDAQVAAAVAKQCGDTFTKGGEARAGSALHQALKEETEATAALEAALLTQAKLEQAASDFQQAERTIQEATTALETLRPQREAVEVKLARVAELRSEETVRAANLWLVTERHESLAKADAEIGALRTDIERRRAALAPGEEAAKLATRADAECRQRCQETEQALTLADARVRAARLRSELAIAHLLRIERIAERDQLRRKQAELAKVRGERTVLQGKLAQTPAVSEKVLKNLQSLDRECSNAEAALNAMAAGLEVIAGDAKVHVSGAILETGAACIITEDTEVSIGESVRLRIRPGGGTSLAEARQRLQEAAAKRQRPLDDLGLATMADATEAGTARRQLDSDLKSISARLEGMGDTTLDEEVSAAEQNAAAVEADVARRVAALEDFLLPAETAEARALTAKCSGLLSEAEGVEAAARTARDAAAQSLRGAGEMLEKANRALDEERRELAGRTAQLSLLLQTHGEDAPRSQILAERATLRAAAENALSETRQSLAALQPDLLAGDLVRYQRAAKQHSDSKTDAETRRAVAQSALVRDGTTDPRADAALATARAEEAKVCRESEERSARAIQLLHELFSAARQELADRFTRPLAERVSGYLECLFGPGARAGVRLENNEFTALQLVRPAHSTGAFKFESLSGGAKEQMAAAFRLAMAEVLAGAHDGCLPVMFDDAFAYADPERVQILQRMLDLAAARGLQVIVLTCDPGRYAALGAKQISLNSPGTLLP
jgi:hypothetical protein